MVMLKKLWKDEAGFIVSAELILIATIAVIGLIVGLAAVRDGITSELSDVAGAMQDINQSYTYNGVLGHSAEVAGSNYIDALDFCDDAEGVSGTDDNCITVAQTPINEDVALTGP